MQTNEQGLSFAGGRRQAPDPQDHAYPMRLLMRAQPLPSSRYWGTDSRLPLDQGDTGTCTGHAWCGFLMAAPLETKQVPSPFDIYRGEVAIDEFSDNDAEATDPDNSHLQSGSSVRAGAKWCQQQGRLKSYVWTFNADEAATWLLLHGPLVAGTDWEWEMSSPDRKGIAHLGGGVAGGHSYLVIGYDRVNKLFRCVNSWGRDWPNPKAKGRFWVTHADMDTLIKREGEMCAAVEQKVIPAANASTAPA